MISWILLLLWQPEAHWVEVIRAEWQLPEQAVEVRQWDGTRVDLLTETHAVEVDFGPKWAEAIGQAVYYAELNPGRDPGIVLLLKPGEDRFGYRCQTVCTRLGIRLWIRRIPGGE